MLHPGMEENSNELHQKHKRKTRFYMWKQPTVYMINYAELSPSWDANNCPATQEIPNILYNPIVQHSVHKSPPGLTNPVHTLPIKA
jgi:hypothetical protein